MLEPQLPQGFLVDLPSRQEHHSHLHSTDVFDVVILRTTLLINWHACTRQAAKAQLRIPGSLLVEAMCHNNPQVSEVL